MLGRAEPGERAQLLQPDQALAIPGLPLPSAGSRRGRGCRAGGAEPPGNGAGVPGGQQAPGSLPGGSQVGWGTRDHPAWGMAAKTAPKALGEGAEQSRTRVKGAWL